MCGLALRFRCRGHVRRPQMSEQKTEPSLDRPRDGSSTRHSSNWLGLWADDINSTLSPQPVAAAGCFLAGRRQRGARLWYRAAGYYGHAIVCPPNQRAPASGTARAGRAQDLQGLGWRFWGWMGMRNARLRAVLWNSIYTELTSSLEHEVYAHVGQPWRDVLEECTLS